MQKIVPNLWFDDQAEEAAKFYTSIFKNSRIGDIARYPKSAEGVAGRPAGSVMTIEFEIDGQKFIGLNGGPIFKFNEAVSFVVTCETQEELDELWEKLSTHPESEQCGWLKDKFGLSWQIIPSGMSEVFNDPDTSKRERAMAAMLKMKKIDIGALRAAAEGK